MSDEKLEEVKVFMNQFDDLEDFEKRYLDINNPSNREALIQMFNDCKRNTDGWEFAKYQRSSETLRIDKILRGKNVDVQTILNEISKYDLSKYKRILLSLDNKNYDDIDKLIDLGIDVFVTVKGDSGVCSLDEFIKMRKYFNDFLNYVNNNNLSNLEKITIAYDYIKRRKFNLENDDRLTNSRSISKSISTGNIVCQGYCKIFCELLKELGFTSNLVYINPNEKETGGHVRVIVQVNDPKYNINEAFAFDPTWDSNMSMAVVEHQDKTISYEISSRIKDEDNIIRYLRDDIRYLFFMIPIYEYSKYFKNEEVSKIEKYPSGEEIELSDTLMTILNYDDKKPKSPFIRDFFPELLLNVKTIEGLSEKEIELFINDVDEVLMQDRFGRLDSISSKL